MHFANLDALRLLVAVPLVLLLVWRSYRRNARLLGSLGQQTSVRHVYTWIALLTTIMLVSVVGIAARPQLDIHSSTTVVPRGDYVMLLDVSRSMAARGSLQEPTNLDRARELLRHVVGELPEARFQIFAYAGLAFPLSTFSNDRIYLEDVLTHGVYVGVIPRTGSNLPNALRVLAASKREKADYARVSDVLLLSDGNMGEAGLAELRAVLGALSETGLRITTIGVGSTEAQRIPLLDEQGVFTGTYERLPDGRPFETSLERVHLQALADATGGAYFHAAQREAIVTHLRRTLPERAPDGEGNVVLVGRRDIGWVLLIPFTAALGILVVRRGELY